MQVKKKAKINYQGGATMLVSVIFLLFISLAVIFGLVSPSVREFKNATTNLNSKQSYFLAESGIEDAIYRTTKNMTISGSETLTLNSNSVTTTITDGNFGQKSISSVGDVMNHERKVSLSVSLSDGLSFSYGIQAGPWGFLIGDDAFIDGSIYSDGPVIGEDDSLVTGSVTSANTASISADQQHGSGAPQHNLIFGRYDSTEDIAQSFIAGATGPLNKAEFYLKKTGSPSNITVRLVYTDDSHNEPENDLELASGTLSASTVSTSYGWVTVTFDSNPEIVSGTKYWLVLDANDSSSKYYTIGANSSGYANGIALTGEYDDDDWDPVTPTAADLFFKVYLQGLSGVIDNVDIGQNGVGNAYAHTVKNSSIAGTNYCQTGSGNNKSCNTSLPDPASIAMPISEQNIQDWKDDALTGGTIYGNPTYTPGGRGITMGPQKIEGNFHLDDKDVLTLTGTIWVTGDFKVDNKAIVKPSSSYGGSSVAIIVDGKTRIRNQADFVSDNATSYVLVLSTNNCPFDPSCADGSDLADAIELASKIDAAILYAANGIIDVRSKAKARQLTGYGIDLGDDSELIYDSGLINQNFVGGPSGSWEVEGWGESE